MCQINYSQALDAHESLILVSFLESETPLSWHNHQVSTALFKGAKGTEFIFQSEHQTIIFLGLGKNPDFKTLQYVFRKCAFHHQDLFEKSCSVVLSEAVLKLETTAISNGLFLGTYRLDHFKKEQKKHALREDDFSLNFIMPESQDVNLEEKIALGHSLALAQIEAFYLVDLPPNQMTPEYLAHKAQSIGAAYSIKVSVYDREQSRALGLHAFVAVGQGSAKEPQFIIMEYVPAKFTKHVGLVGKGITFDTGGLNIKTQGMVHMKCDMGGAASVIGAMQIISAAQLPVKVTAIVPACENSVDRLSFLPSDVISSYSGHSIEIIDTDAEGRLILADGLSYLHKNFQPDVMVDIATLTGSSVGTFGYESAALFSNNDELSHALQKSGSATGERVWPLPLWDVYKADIHSDIADVKNYSGKPVAGAISAAKFLEFFIDQHPAWAHLDIAGVAFVDNEFAKSKNASAFGVHLLFNYVANL